MRCKIKVEPRQFTEPTYTKMQNATEQRSKQEISNNDKRSAVQKISSKRKGTEIFLEAILSIVYDRRDVC